MTNEGIRVMRQELTWLTLTCGHRVAYMPPVPSPGSELTCGVCGEPTEVPPLHPDLKLIRRIAG